MNLKNIQQQINQAIEQLHFGDSPKELYEPLTYIMSLGGKRLRPLLVLLGYGLYRSDYEKILSVAISVEVFHNFTLLHDDIMDKAPIRRGMPTVHEKWNNNIALLSGDVMLVKAYELLGNCENQYFKTAFQAFNQCAAEVCEGQQIDMNFEQENLVSESEYIAMIRLKTAVLLGFSLKLGALLAGANAEQQQKINDFGVNIGIGFQIKDDLLDVYADQSKFGKQVGGDIISNKKTFLLIKALENANSAQKQSLDYWITSTNFDKNEKIKAVIEIYDQLKIKELASQKMQEFFAKGFELLDNLEVAESQKQTLRKLTEDLIEREN